MTCQQKPTNLDRQCYIPGHYWLSKTRLFENLFIFCAGMKKFAVLCCAALLFVAVTRADEEEEGEKKKKDSVGTVIGIDLGTTYSW